MSGTPSTAVVIPDDLEFPVSSFLVPACYAGDLASVIVPEGMIRDRVKKLAQEIHEVVGDQPLSLLCVLKGSYRFFTALVDELTAARCSTQLMVEFIRVKSYVDTARSNELQIIGLGNLSELHGKNVMVVDDIVDSGTTLSKLFNTLAELQVKQSWSALLVSKRVPRAVNVREDFVAFSIPDRFIVGYGLDYNQKFRDLNHVCLMSAAGIEKYKHEKA